jgi:glycosyltransferase involved in cell wall biosynthesis
LPSSPISGFVITYNRADLLGTCLRSLRFADELIVIDKSSTDDTRKVAQRYADRVITVPWSPTVEETRIFALEQCRYDWIVFLDDDEMLSPGAIEYLRGPRRTDAADAVALPLRHWILGTFDPNTCYWPERHIRFFRKGALSFGTVVHAGMALHTDRIEQVAVESDIFIEHLSHSDAAQFIERTNRYTSRPQRARTDQGDSDLIEFAHRSIDAWLARSHHSDRNDYAAAVALLKAIYEIVDRVKVWEEQRGLDGVAAFHARCTELQRAYNDLETRLGIATGMRPRSRLRQMIGKLLC